MMSAAWGNLRLFDSGLQDNQIKAISVISTVNILCFIKEVDSIIYDFFLYRINPPTFPANIFTAIARRMTPKNLRMASMPAFPSNLEMKSSEWRTR